MRFFVSLQGIELVVLQLLGLTFSRLRIETSFRRSERYKSYSVNCVEFKQVTRERRIRKIGIKRNIKKKL